MIFLIAVAILANFCISLSESHIADRLTQKLFAETKNWMLQPIINAVPYLANLFFQCVQIIC